MSIKSVIRNFLNDETGATAIEYGLMVGLIAAVIAVIVASLGTEIQSVFEKVCKAINANAAACAKTTT